MEPQPPVNDFKREFAALATLRDELRLKAHLARAEVRSQLDELERRLLLAEEQFQRAKSQVEEDSALVEHKLTGLVADLKIGYEKIKRAFESP